MAAAYSTIHTAWLYPNGVNPCPSDKQNSCPRSIIIRLRHCNCNSTQKVVHRGGLSMHTYFQRVSAIQDSGCLTHADMCSDDLRVL